MTVVKSIVKRNFYRDSVQMMLLSQQIKREPGIIDAAILMGTDLNKDSLLIAKMLTGEAASASASDTIISLICNDEISFKNAIEKVEQLLTSQSKTTQSEFSDVSSALKSFDKANLAMLSIPGQYIKEVAEDLLNKKIHLFVFSDHVSLDDEIYLKKIAVKNDLLFMGPEAGTSIINGVVLGFGNRVRSGPVGIIGASGTGIQESTTLLDLCDIGITNAIGVGGRDMKRETGGLMTHQAIDAFEKDDKTKSVLLVSKPVDKVVRNNVIEYIKKHSKKNYVLCLIGDQDKLQDSGQIQFAKSIQSAVIKILKTVNDDIHMKTVEKFTKIRNVFLNEVTIISSELRAEQKFVRGFFAGGTLCYEASVILSQIIGDIQSNLSSDSKYHIGGFDKSKGHTLVDFGDEEFTTGRPHPIIDPTLRITRLLEEANDPNVAVIIMDIIVGYSAANYTVELHAGAIKKAISIAADQGRTLSIFVYVCGTEKDISENELKALDDSGAYVFRSNAMMSVIAGLITSKINPETFKQVDAEFLSGGMCR